MGWATGENGDARHGTPAFPTQPARRLMEVPSIPACAQPTKVGDVTTLKHATAEHPGF